LNIGNFLLHFVETLTDDFGPELLETPNFLNAFETIIVIQYMGSASPINEVKEGCKHKLKRIEQMIEKEDRVEEEAM
jgi:hypothetical protein